MKNKTRTPKTNTTFIKKWYKESTIPRLSDLNYKSHKEINECPIITEWLDLCFFTSLKHGYVQDHLFHWIFLHNKIKVVRNVFTTNDEKTDFKKLLGY